MGAQLAVLNAQSIVIGALLTHSGKSAVSVSADLGCSREHVRQSALSPRGPMLAAVADVTDMCGVEVVLFDRAAGERVGTVTPPRRVKELGDGMGLIG